MSTYQAPSSRPHGTYAQYKRGCRCQECVAYQNGRVAKNREARMTSGRLTHGTRSAYDAGCRCEQCRTARHKIAVREWEQREASAEEASR